MKRIEQSNQILWRRITTNGDDMLIDASLQHPDGVFLSARSSQPLQHSTHLDTSPDRYPVHMLNSLNPQQKTLPMNIPCVRVTSTSVGLPIPCMPNQKRAEDVTTNIQYSQTTEDVPRFVLCRSSLKSKQCYFKTLYRLIRIRSNYILIFTIIVL